MADLCHAAITIFRETYRSTYEDISPVRMLSPSDPCCLPECDAEEHENGGTFEAHSRARNPLQECPIAQSVAALVVVYQECSGAPSGWQTGFTFSGVRTYDTTLIRMFYVLLRGRLCRKLGCSPHAENTEMLLERRRQPGTILLRRCPPASMSSCALRIWESGLR